MVALIATLVFFTLYAAAGLILRQFEHRFIFFPNYNGRLSGNWQPTDLSPEDVWLRTTDGVKLHAWWLATAGAEFTFLVFHGSAGNIAQWADTYRFLRTLPANVLGVDYRGYGQSEGTPYEEGIYRDAEAAHDYLVRERRISQECIIGFGQSLGTPVIADLAMKRQLGGIVLEAPFPSTRVLAKKLYPLLSWFHPFMRTKFDLINKVRRIGIPILIVHFVGDPGVPFTMGQEVFQEAHEPKLLLPLKGKGHVHAAVLTPDILREKLLEFLEIVERQNARARLTVLRKER